MKVSNRVYFFASLVILTFLSAILTGCGGMGKMLGTVTTLGRESEQLMKMSSEEVEGLISPDIDINRIKSDPDGILGKYVRVTGKIDLKGSKDFPMEMKNANSKDSPPPFILEDIAFVIPVQTMPDVQQGDLVEVIALVSKSRFLKTVAELYPEQKMPDLVTLIAKDVRPVTDMSEPEPVPETLPEGVDMDGDGTPDPVERSGQ